jgi:hypothetical protein
MIQYAGLAQLVETNSLCVCACSSQGVIDLQLAPGSQMWRDREDNRRGMILGSFLGGLSAEQPADIEQNGRDRNDWDERHHHGNNAEPRQQDHHYARRGGITDPSAHRLPAGMSNVHGIDERVTHQAANEVDHAVGREIQRQRPRGRRPEVGMRSRSSRPSVRGCRDSYHRKLKPRALELQAMRLPMAMATKPAGIPR